MAISLINLRCQAKMIIMSTELSNIPGYRNIKSEQLAEILDSVHDIAQELAYIDGARLEKLDALNKSYVSLAFGFATKRAKKELYDIMLTIRNARTPQATLDENQGNSEH